MVEKRQNFVCLIINTCRKVKYFGFFDNIYLENKLIKKTKD